MLCLLHLIAPMDREEVTNLDRKEFIGYVQAALGKRGGKPDPPYPRLQESPQRVEEKAAEVRLRLKGRGEELLEKLGQVGSARGWKVHRANDVEGALDQICSVARSITAKLVVRSDQEIFQRLSPDHVLAQTGIETTVATRHSSMSEEDVRRRMADADLGITGVDYAMAETGTVVLLPRAGLSRLVSLAPTVHLAIVRPDEVLETLDDLFVLRRLAYYQNGEDMGSYMNFITGPSRTADIEQTLVVGVHGPKEAHLLLLSG